MITDREGVIEYVNPAFEAVYRLHSRRIHGPDPAGSEIRPAEF